MASEELIQFAIYLATPFFVWIGIIIFLAAIGKSCGVRALYIKVLLAIFEVSYKFNLQLAYFKRSQLLLGLTLVTRHANLGQSHRHRVTGPRLRDSGGSGGYTRYFFCFACQYENSQGLSFSRTLTPPPPKEFLDLPCG